MAGLHFDITANDANFQRKISAVQASVRNASRTVQEEGEHIDGMIQRLSRGIAGIGAGLSAGAFVRQLIEIRGEFQKLEVAFSTMLGSKERADALMREAVQLAATTPFDLQGVASGYKQLLAYGVAMEDVTETMTRLGNIAAGLSVPLNDLVYLYGTTRAQGRLYTQDFNQFTGRGIPMIRELSKEFGVAESEIKGMVEAGRVGFPEVQKVIENLTNEGGMFYNLMEAQSKTLSGQVSNLGDSIQQMFNEIGKSTQGVLSEGISAAAYLVENYEQVGKALMTLVAAYGTYKAAVMAAAAIHKMQFVSGEAKAFMELTRGLTLARKAQEAFNLASIKNPYILIASAVVAAGVALWQFAKEAKDTEEIISDLDTATSDYAQSVGRLTSLADRYDELSSKTGRTEAETDELRKTMGSLAASVPDAVSAFDEFGNVLSVNTDKIREFDAAQKEALRLTLKSQIEAGEGELYTLNNKLKKEQDIFQKKTYTRERVSTISGEAVVIGREEVSYTQEEINAAAKRATELYAKLEKVNASLTKAKELYDGITADDTGKTDTSATKQLQNINALIAERTEKIKTLKMELADLRSGKTQSDDILKAIDGKEAELKSEISALEKLTGTKAGGARTPKGATYATDADSRAADMELENTRLRLQSEAEVQRERKDGLAEYYALMRRMEDEEYRHEVENIERSRAEALRKAKGEDTDRINAAYDRQLSAAEQSWILGIQEIDRDEQNAEYKRRLSAYESFVDGYVRIAEERRDRLKEISDAETEGTITKEDAARKLADAERIAGIDMDTLMSGLGLSVEGISSELTGIVDGVIASGIDTISAQLPALTAELSRLEDTNTDPERTARTKAAVEALKNALSNVKDAQMDFGEGTDKTGDDTVEKWEQMKNAMSSVDDMIGVLDSSFGDMLGDAGRDAMDVMRTVSSSTMSILASISTTATAASASISTVEKASIILTVISAALRVVMAITNAIIKNTSAHAKLQEQIDASRERVEEMQREQDRWERSLDSKAGTEYWKSFSEGAKGYQAQLAEARRQMELAQAQMDKANTSKKKDEAEENYRDAEDTYNEIADGYREHIHTLMDEFAGADLASFSDSMADAIFEGFEEGLSTSKEIWDDTLDGMVLEILKSGLSRQLEDVFKPMFDRMEEYVKDGELSDDELDLIMAEGDKAYGNAEAIIEAYKRLYEGLDIDIDSSQQSKSTPFESMSQDTADELNGRFTALQITSASIDGKMDVIAGLNRQIAEKLGRSAEQTVLGVQATINILNEVRDINAVTSRYLPRLERIERGIDTLVTKL